MSWSNKRRIHLARGTTNNILAISTNNIDDPNLFTDGQPLFNKDRGYLGIANGKQDAKNIMPIKVREVEGYGNEIDNNTFTLKDANTKANHYLFTGDSNGTYLKSDNPLYFIKGSISLSNYSTNYILALINKNNNDVIDIKAPITTNSNIDVDSNATLTSTNINVTYLKNSNTPYVTLGSSLITLNQNTELDNGKSFTSGYNTTLGTFANATYSGTNNIYGVTTIAGSQIKLNGQGNGNKITISGNELALSAPTTLTSTITGKNSSDTTTLIIAPSSGTFTGKALYITSNGLSNGTNYLSVSNSSISAGKNLNMNNNSISGANSIEAASVTASGQVQGGSLKSTGTLTVGGVLTVNGTGTHTFNGNINASGKIISCGTLEVNTINLHV